MNQGPPSPDGRTRRVRRKTQGAPEDLSTDEQLMIRQAIENSKLDTGISDEQEIASIPPGAVYHPTVEEFKDPLVYIAKIRREAETYGICKVSVLVWAIASLFSALIFVSAFTLPLAGRPTSWLESSLPRRHEQRQKVRDEEAARTQAPAGYHIR